MFRAEQKFDSSQNKYFETELPHQNNRTPLKLTSSTKIKQFKEKKQAEAHQERRLPKKELTPPVSSESRGVEGQFDLELRGLISQRTSAPNFTQDIKGNQVIRSAQIRVSEAQAERNIKLRKRKIIVCTNRLELILWHSKHRLLV